MRVRPDLDAGACLVTAAGVCPERTLLCGTRVCDRVADDPFRRQLQLRPAAYLLPDALQQQPDSRFPDLFDGLADTGYGRNQKIQIGIVVERHHGNIFGDPQTRFADGFDRAEQDRIAQGEYRRGTVGRWALIWSFPSTG